MTRSASWTAKSGKLDPTSFSTVSQDLIGFTPGPFGLGQLWGLSKNLVPGSFDDAVPTRSDVDFGRNTTVHAWGFARSSHGRLTKLVVRIFQDEGTGFWLAIVKEIVQAHGWSIAVGESEEGGARFEVTGLDD